VQSSREIDYPARREGKYRLDIYLRFLNGNHQFLAYNTPSKEIIAFLTQQE
jgi:hypothetical protein